MLRRLFFALPVLVIFTQCEQNQTYKTVLNDPENYRKSMKQVTDVIVHDIFSPPVASRIYAYSNIAAYETMAKKPGSAYVSLSGQLNGLTVTPDPTDENVDFQLAALHAFLTVGKTLIFSEEKVDAFRTAFYDSLKANGLPKKIEKASLAYGEIVAKHILTWADSDMYKQTRTYPKYTILKEDQYWKPTPPDYMEGIEPHWKVIRTMVLDSANQYVPEPPLAIDMNPESAFYRQLMEVYTIGVKLEDEHVSIAKFWDCNPYVSHHRGHAMFATKKITPGGHWMGITEIASRKAGSDFDETIAAYTQVSLALFDGFISCWDEKWRSIVVRPETLINQYIDQKWVPLLQTPPFPEYTSGHSVISTAASIVLTNLYGDNFEFLDTTEEEFGLPARQFSSFRQAAQEAAISRLYGGIHYMMAIDHGVKQGDQVGNFIVSNIQLITTPQVAALKN